MGKVSLAEKVREFLREMGMRIWQEKKFSSQNETHFILGFLDKDKLVFTEIVVDEQERIVVVVTMYPFVFPKEQLAFLNSIVGCLNKRYLVGKFICFTDDVVKVVSQTTLCLGKDGEISLGQFQEIFTRSVGNAIQEYENFEMIAQADENEIQNLRNKIGI